MCQNVSMLGRTLLFIACCAIFGIAAFVGYLMRRLPQDGGVILDGVQIQHVTVGGLYREEAEAEVRRRLPPEQNQSVSFSDGNKEFKAQWQEIGLRYGVWEAVSKAVAVGRTGGLQQVRERIVLLTRGINVPVMCSLDETRAREWLTALAEEMDVEPRDARAVWTGTSVRFHPERAGRRIDVEETIRTLHRMTEKPTFPHRVRLVQQTTKPSLTCKDLRHLNAILSEYGTSFNAREIDRVNNIRLAAAALDHEFVREGGVFSYNDRVGPRLERFGYRLAPIISDDEIIQGVGGGVCQVATTLYNAALLAGLEILSRTHHSRPVKYVPRGRDATVFYGNIDLRIRNNTPLPVYLRVMVTGNRVIARFFGNQSQRRRVDLQCVRDEVIPAPEVRIPDATLQAGKETVEDKGRSGYRVSIRRVITLSDSRSISEVVSNDYYRPRPRRIRVGAATISPAAVVSSARQVTRTPKGAYHPIPTLPSSALPPPAPHP